MPRFSDWLTEKYTSWENTQGSTQTYAKYATYLCVDAKVLVNIMLGKALPNTGDLMAIAAKEGLEVYDVLEKDRPEEGVIEVFSSLGTMPTDFRMRMAHAIYEAEETVKGRNISTESDEAKQVFIEAFERWGFHYQGNFEKKN
ncbi:hypothetical protein ADN00_12850 [Ornatilinea apprima]|uniref:Uncharacterized protein n=1 Tax=Ornatilinea apprima TaxID=1134406 RepID=A0A0P6X338_9CHLR|nr:hypothetical protein [Ornatilinea apprima]KPL75525.1 hypothetical protein ADN00_12850 [Ornatilinea apprima]